MKKRILSLLIALVLILCPALSVVALSPSGESESYVDVGKGLWELKLGDAYGYLRDALLRGEERISLASYHLSPTELAELYETLYYTEAELFVISSSYSYTTALDQNVATLLPTYKYGAEEMSEVLADFRARTDAMIAEMPTGLSPLGRLIFLYDYLATHFVYQAEDANYDAYGMLVEGNGVCQAYSLLLRYLLRKVGIAAECVTSEALNHEWNIVQLGSSWYHVDVTWDDADDEGALGQVDHEYFLLSDAAFMAGEHRAFDWVSPISATDTRYDGVFDDVTSRFVFDDNGKIYAVRGKYICSYSEQGGFVNLKKIDALRYTAGGQIWSGLFSGLACIGGRLLYNTHSELRAFDPETETVTCLLSYATTVHSYMYGFWLDSSTGRVTCSFKTGANDEQYAVDTRQIAFTVTWSILGAEYTELYLYGETPICKQPTEIPDDRYRFTFLGWDKTPVPVTDDVVYTAEYEMTELFSESARELLSCVETAGDEGESLYARYVALTRALEIKDDVDLTYEGVPEALSSLQALVDAYDADAADSVKIFAGWIPLP